METFAKLIKDIDDVVWGIPMIVILFGTHLFMTFRTGIIQRHLFKGIKLSVTQDGEGEGEISQFGALTTALAATIGTGNIVGVATAIISGGPGAVLWMWLIGVFGMSTKYSETLMSLKYRVQSKDGRMLGGAMYALERGLGQKWLAVLFAVFAAFAAFGIGCMTQSNSIAEAFSSNYNIPPWIMGVLVSALVAIVILGGVKSIAKVCEKLVPFMAIFYVLGCLIILIMNAAYILPALKLIITSAFSPQAGFGGATGFAVSKAIRFGCARGLFSNESGLGSAPLVAAAAKTKNPVRQSLVSMTGTFWDTVVICLLTGLTLVSSVLKNPEVAQAMTNNNVLTFAVFAQIPTIGRPLITIALSLFAFSTILGWSYYGERAAEYLVGPRIIKLYKLLFVIFTFVGTVTALDVVWNIADILNGLMVVPNVIGIVLLSGVIVKESKKFINDLDAKSDDDIPVVETKNSK
ncbi:MAG: sodium:alanine symporter family protein [Firmicutes bacterium]|nr:sodium:alanine symporter family protein [Bacillota bacterium]